MIPLAQPLVRPLLTGSDMNFKTLFPVALAAFALACGAPKPILDAGSSADSGAQEPTDAGPVDSGMASDSGTPSDAGSPDSGTTVDAGVVDAGAACDTFNPCVLNWTEPEHYPTVVDHHTSFVAEADHGAYLYIVGGVRTVAGDVKEVYSAIRRAKINPTGIDAWTEVGNLPTPLAFAAQVINGNHIYLMAGLSKDMSGEFASGKVMVGEISSTDGSIAWTFGPNLTAAVLHGTAVVLDNKLYLIGGSAQQPKGDVIVSQLDANGVPGPWAVAASLPVPRSHHTAVVHGGSIFLMGGFSTNQVPQAPVLKSTHDASGKLTGWVVAGDMPDSPWTAGASVWGDSLFVVGGGEGGPGSELFVDRVRQARFLPDNTLTGFADVTPLPVARSHVHQAPIYRGKVYSVGGRLWPSGTSMDRVFIGAFQ